MAAARLVEKLNAAVDGGDEPLRDNYKLLLAYAAGELAFGGGGRRGDAGREALRTVLGCFGAMQPTGVAWRDPRFRLPAYLLGPLAEEARQARSRAVFDDGHWAATGGPVAEAVARSAELTAIARQVDPRLHPSGGDLYLYYESGGQGRPHVDTDFFALTAMVMLERVRVPSACSHLLILQGDGAMERISLDPGEVILFWGGSTVHAREQVAEGERVTAFIAGFRGED
jgi:hypothetical protein